MSWNVSFIGTPEKVAEALEKHSETMTGQSRVEYDAAVPHMAALVRQNYNATQPLILSIYASGSGYTENGVEKQRTTQVKLEYSYAKFVI